MNDGKKKTTKAKQNPMGDINNNKVVNVTIWIPKFDRMNPEHLQWFIIQ